MDPVALTQSLDYIKKALVKDYVFQAYKINKQSFTDGKATMSSIGGKFGIKDMGTVNQYVNEALNDIKELSEVYNRK